MLAEVSSAFASYLARHGNMHLVVAFVYSSMHAQDTPSVFSAPRPCLSLRLVELPSCCV